MAKFGFADLNSNLNPQDFSSGASSALNDLASKIVAARVKDIILDNQHPKFAKYGGWAGLGTIEYEIVGDQTGVTDKSPYALPLLPYLKNYPLVQEIVILFQLPNKDINEKTSNTNYYYLNPVSIWNHPHSNAFPNPVQPGQINPSQEKTYQQIEAGSSRKVDDTEEETNLDGLNPSGGVFIEKPNIHPLVPYVGDIIVEGRFGNSIRLGSTNQSQGTAPYKNNWSSTGETNSPIMILRNGQPNDASEIGWVPIVENIEKDLSSIYLTSTQSIPIVTSNERYNSFKKPPTLPRVYNSNQIILSSGRLLFNTTSDDIILSSKSKISINAINEIGIDSDNTIAFNAPRISLGGPSAREGIIKGNKFMPQFKLLVQQLNNLASALEKARVWPNGVEAPDPVVVPIATSIKGVTDDLLDLLNDKKQPLLSKVVKTL